MSTRYETLHLAHCFLLQLRLRRTLHRLGRKQKQGRPSGAEPTVQQGCCDKLGSSIRVIVLMTSQRAQLFHSKYCQFLCTHGKRTAHFLDRLGRIYFYSTS